MLYKSFLLQGKSLKSHVSLLTDNPDLSLDYQLNKKTVPTIGKLFAFTTIDDLRNYLSEMKSDKYSYALAKCNGSIYSSVGSNFYFPNLRDYSSNNIKLFWDGKKDAWEDGNPITCPTFAVLCNWITPVRLIDILD